MNDPEKPSAGLIRILRHVQENADFYRVLLGKKGDPAFCAQSFRRFIEQQFRHMPFDHVERGTLRVPFARKTGVEQRPFARKTGEVQAELSRPPIDLSVNYILHAGIGAILRWLENDEPCTPEQIAVWLNQFSMADMSVSLGLDTKTPGGR